ncbi:MAG TPA: dihydrodipicolinate reductase C-terminal domain-containing protein [Conexibacter sp.]|nr:dihydrodipicolinate reductase C-terminal domain-containing protein [Conexibacter sp.]
MSDVELALVGMGKMGRALALLAPERGFRVVAELDPARPDYAGITRESLRGAQVAIEFTAPDAAPGNVRACAAAGCPVVVGTTGWYDQLPAVAAEIERAGGAMLTAPNFSVGVAVFDRVVAEAARLFGQLEGFDAHLVETHHAAKRDAPSGTAGALAKTASAALGRPIPVTSIRTGHVPGTHEVVFDAPFEQVRLVHEARDRRVFAEGALVAARWIVGRRGVFTLADVLGGSAAGVA